jgi:hypothetical protein
MSGCGVGCLQPTRTCVRLSEFQLFQDFLMNSSLTYQLAVTPMSTLGFSGAVTTSSVNLPGPGGQSGNGFPMLHAGQLTGLSVFDGTNVRKDVTRVTFAADDKISVYCQNVGSNFTVKVRINGNTTNLAVASVPYNCTLFVTVEFILKRM